MSHPEPAHTPAWRRGLVQAVDAPNGRVRVQFPDEDNLVSDWLPVAMPFALGARAFWLPRTGSQVAVLLDEHGEDGVVLGALYSQADPPPGVASAHLFHLEMEDGTKLSLDPDNGCVSLNTPGKVVVQTGSDLSATVGGNLTANVSGNANLQAAAITLKASQITLDAPNVTATAVLQAQGAVCANAGITTSSGGPVPGTLSVQGPVQSQSKVQAPDAVLGGKSFNGHVHGGVQGGGSQTSAPV
jgi:phage baseplate assembly protein V